MRPPQKPIKWIKVMDSQGDKVIKFLGKKELFNRAKEFNKRYLYWSELKYRTSSPKEQEYLWTFMKLLRSGRYEKVPYKSINIKYSLPPFLNKHLHTFDKFLAGNIEIQSKRLCLEKRYIVSSLMEEAIASSIIEGAITTRKAAKEMLKQKRKPKNKSEQMILNGYETMQTILKRKDEELTPEFLLEVQHQITNETLDNPKDSGRFRDNNEIYVGDQNNEYVYHQPPDYKKVKTLIKEVCDFANNDEKGFIHPVIKGIILHFLIGYIHPFNDGNGRTARSIFYWYVLSRGYWLFEYMAVSRRILRSKQDYGKAYLYTEYDEMDLTYFIKYNLECIEDALEDLLEHIKKKQVEQKEVQKIIEKTRGLNHRQASILEEFMSQSDKTFSILEISQTYNVVYQTARTDLLLLTKKGLLTMKKISKKFLFKLNPKNKLFQAK